MILEYAAQLINKIEKCIIADSVNRITGIEENGDELNFKVHFENFYATKTSSIPEEFMVELDKLRETSFFAPQIIAQKTSYSFTCPNVLKKLSFYKKKNNIQFLSYPSTSSLFLCPDKILFFWFVVISDSSKFVKIGKPMQALS